VEKLETGEITKDEYDKWLYRYPEFDSSHRWAKIPSKELSDKTIKGMSYKKGKHE